MGIIIIIMFVFLFQSVLILAECVLLIHNWGESSSLVEDHTSTRYAIWYLDTHTHRSQWGSKFLRRSTISWNGSDPAPLRHIRRIKLSERWVDVQEDGDGSETSVLNDATSPSPNRNTKYKGDKEQHWIFMSKDFHHNFQHTASSNHRDEIKCRVEGFK